MSKHLVRLLSLASLSVAIAGCGKSDAPTATAASSTGSGASASSAVDPGKPAAASDLVGMWFRNDDPAANADDVIGVEFSTDNKLTIVGRPAGRQAADEMTLDATKLDGGRVRLAAPGMAGVTQTVQCNLNGDTLTITPESAAAADFAGGTFTRLPAGKTIVARYQERVKERLAEARALGEKLNAFLKQPNLAIVPADGGGVGSLRVALALTEANGTFAGTGLMTVANATVERQVQVATLPNSVPPFVNVTLGPVTGPAGAKPMQQESFAFAASAKGDAIELRDNQAHVLKPDADATKQLADAYAAAVKKQRDLLDAFHAKLGALVLAEGDARPGQPTMRAALLRVPDKDQYLLAAYRGSESSLLSTSFTVPHVVMLQDDKPLLVNPQTRQILDIAGDGEARTIQGNFNGTDARMRITRSMSLDDLKARQAAIKTFVDGLKASPLSLCGEFYESYTYEMGAVRPVRLDLSSADGKMLAGTFRADAFDLDLPITGEVTPTLLGLAIRYTPAKGSVPSVARFDEDGPTLLAVELGADGTPVALAGRAERGDNANRLDVAPYSHERVAALRKQFDDQLAKGGAFKWARTGNTGGGTDVMTLTLRPGDDASKLVGTAGFRKAKTAPLAGTIAEDRGQLVIDLTVAETPPKSIATGSMRLWVLPYGDTFYLSGRRDWAGEPPHSFACYGPVP